MCGIAGYTHLRQRSTTSRIRGVTSTLVHRGPDQQGIYQSDTASLGAVRLQVIDLDGGEQPIQTEDGDTVIVFNGEIYNHHELREELSNLGHRFKSRCDTEVVLRAFRQWDTGCFARFRGMFAVALWTESEQRLILARDRFGIKPLYIHQRGDDLYFGSELKAILEHPEVERELDFTGLSYYLSLNYVPCPYTLVKGVRKLRPAHWMEWRAGQTRTERYWQLRFQPQPGLGMEDAKQQLDGLLRQSVREHLAADVPVGLWASGGLDSSTLLHYAAEQSSAKLKTFSVSFSGRSFDESPYFRAMAQAYGTEHREFDLNEDVNLAGAIEDLSYYSDEPSADAGALPVWFLSKMTREDVTVALSGEGADELFGGYNTYRADRYAQYLRLMPRSLRQMAAGALRWLPVSDDKISFEYKCKRMMQGSLLSPVDAHLFWNGTFSAREKAELCRFNGHPSLRKLSDMLPYSHELDGTLDQFLYLDQNYYLADDILYKTDRMSMAHSLEVRPPFLDHRIAEFAGGLPSHLKMQGGNLKVLLRQLMRDKLPATVLNRPKEGFDIPAHHWFRSSLKPLLLDTLTPRAVEQNGLFHPAAIDQLLKNHLERRANLGYHLWGLVTLFLWMRRWDIQTAPAREEVSTPLHAVTYSR